MPAARGSPRICRRSPREHPHVSAILPVKNGERYLAEAIESILEQSPARQRS